MYSLSLISILVIISSFSLSLLFSTDDLNFDTSLFDIESFPLPDESEYLPTDATLSSLCAGQDDLSFTNEEMSLFARENGAQCLPSLNTGVEASQLFSAPLELLENTILPFNDDENFDDPSIGDPSVDDPSSVWSEALDEVTGNDNVEDLERWQPSEDPVRYGYSDSDDCRTLTGHLGDFNSQVCCNGFFVSRHERIYTLARNVVAKIDARTLANSDYQYVGLCVCTFPVLFIIRWFVFLQTFLDINFLVFSRQSLFPIRFVLSVMHGFVSVAIVT